VTGGGRRKDLAIGVLIAAIAVLVFVAVAGLGGAPVATEPTPSGATAPVPATKPAVASSSTPTAAPASPSMKEIAPGVMADCGRIEPAACERSIALARAGNEADVGSATLVVVDDLCAPDVMCDRMFPFDSVVVFVTAGGDTTGWYAFHAFGLDASMPTQAERWEDEIPRHIVDRIRAALATP
jgi:hypothetical protein